MHRHENPYDITTATADHVHNGTIVQTRASLVQSFCADCAPRTFFARWVRLVCMQLCLVCACLRVSQPTLASPNPTWYTTHVWYTYSR